MKKWLSAMTIVLGIFLVSTAGYSQSITLTWDDANLPKDHLGNDLAVNSLSQDLYPAMFVIYAPTGIKGTPDATLGTDYFLKADDQLSNLNGYVNPLPYFGPGSGGYGAIPLVAPQGVTELKVFVRVFDNIAYDAFDAQGHWNGTFIDNSMPFTYYFETPIYTVDVPIIPGPESVEISISGMMANQGPLPDSGPPVPEPSAIFLTAMGSCWIVSRLRRK